MTRDGAAKTREALIEAAVILFADRGFEATSVRAIVGSASATKGAFYHHFSSKDDVLFAVHERFVERQINTLQTIADRCLSSSARLSMMIEALIADHDVHGREIAVFNRERNALHRADFEPIRVLRHRVEDIITDVITQGIEAKEFRPLPSVRLVVFAVQGVTAWLYEWYRRAGPMPASEIGRFYVSMLLDGLRVPEFSNDESSSGSTPSARSPAHQRGVQ